VPWREQPGMEADLYRVSKVPSESWKWPKWTCWGICWVIDSKPKKAKCNEYDKCSGDGTH